MPMEFLMWRQNKICHKIFSPQFHSITYLYFEKKIVYRILWQIKFFCPIGHSKGVQEIDFLRVLRNFNQTGETVNARTCLNAQKLNRSSSSKNLRILRQTKKGPLRASNVCNKYLTKNRETAERRAFSLFFIAKYCCSGNQAEIKQFQIMSLAKWAL